MSYTFDGATAFMDRTASVPVTGPACSISWWVKPTSVASAQTVSQVICDTSTQDYIILRQNASSFALISHNTNTNGNASASEIIALTAGVWTNLVGVFSSGSLRAIYMNGANKRTSAGVVGAYDATPNHLYVGKRSSGEFFNGLLAMGAYWNIALGDSDALALYTTKPNLVQNANLVAYYPMDDNQGGVTYNDAKGAFNLTITAATFVPDNPFGGTGYIPRRIFRPVNTIYYLR